MKARILAWLGARSCGKGRHAPLDWYRGNERPVPITNRAMEMIFAVGFGTLMSFIGYCPRCGRAVEWSSDDPRTPAQRRADRKARSAAKADLIGTKIVEVSE